MRTSQALGLRTEASARFEKQLHPEQAMAAQRLAARLMVELCGARLVPGTLDAYPRPAEPRVGARCGRRGSSGCSASDDPEPDEVRRRSSSRLGFEREPSDGRRARDACRPGATATSSARPT